MFRFDFAFRSRVTFLPGITIARAEELSGKYGGATLDQLAYAWLLAHPARLVPVLGTNKVERIESAEAAAAIELERQDWYRLWEAAQGCSVP